MNALDIWFECRRLSVTLVAKGERLSYRGKKAAIDQVLPILKANKPEVLACVVSLAGLPIEDGPFSPWGPHLTPERVTHLQRELFEVVDELSRWEGWRDDDYDLVIGAIERQPISTLRPDLAYFRDRLTVAKAASAVRLGASPRNQRDRGLEAPRLRGGE